MPAHPGHQVDAGAATEDLAHVHRDGASVQVGARLHPKVPVPFGPEIEEPLPGLVHAGHVIFAAGLDQEDADLRVLRQSPCHDRSRRTRTADDEVVLGFHLGRQLRLIAFIEAMLEPYLGSGWRPTGDYFGWDFKHDGGAKLEIKQAAARQTWDELGPAPLGAPLFG